MNVVLMGYRGTGKTEVSKILAERLNKTRVSTDEEFERKKKTKIDKFVKKYGWDEFRNAEAQIVEYISSLDDQIIDTGGGVVMRNENVLNLKRNSIVIVLTADIRSIKERLKKSRGRPSLTKKNPVDEVKDVMKERDPKYKKASDYIVDTSRFDPEEVSDLIEHYIRMEMD